MKAILIALALAVAVPGCTLFQPAPIPVSATLSPAAQSVQKALNEANVTLAAAANVVAQNVTEGILSKPDGQAYVAKLKELAQKVDQAKALLDKGLVLDAKNQAELLSSLIIALHKEVASRRKQ